MYNHPGHKNVFYSSSPRKMKRNLDDSFKLLESCTLFGEWDKLGDVPREGMSLYDEEVELVIVVAIGGVTGLHVEQEDDTAIKFELEFGDLIT